MQENKLAMFEEKEIRREWYNDDWYYSIGDVIFALTDSKDPKDYWYRLKTRVNDESKIELSTICRRLKLLAKDGKMRETDCANTKGILRIIQSIPSPKAEPFKMWLAQVGSERLEEIVNPELATGKITGKARKEIEEKIGRKIANKNNYKNLTNLNTKRISK